MKTIKLPLPNASHGWLEKLAETGVYGPDAEAVAQRFIHEGIARELRAPDGFLVRPPRSQRTTAKEGNQ